MSEGGMTGDIKGSGAERTDRDGVAIASASDGDGAHYANAGPPGPADDNDEELTSVIVYPLWPGGQTHNSDCPNKQTQDNHSGGARSHTSPERSVRWSPLLSPAHTCHSMLHHGSDRAPSLSIEGALIMELHLLGIEGFLPPKD